MRFSRRSLVSSSRSAVVRPVRPFDRSACACLTQLPNADATRSSSRATAVTLLPSSRTKRTACCLNSFVKRRRGRRPLLESAIVDIVSAFRKMSTKPDQAHRDVRSSWHQARPQMMPLYFSTPSGPRPDRRAASTAAIVPLLRPRCGARPRKSAQGISLWAFLDNARFARGRELDAEPLARSPSTRCARSGQFSTRSRRSRSRTGLGTAGGEPKASRRASRGQPSATTREAGRAPGWTRTSDPRLRRPVLYPTELRAHENLV